MRSCMHLMVLFFASICFVGSFSNKAEAQIVPWALGMYGAMQACPYDYRVAGGAYSRTDEEKRIAREIKDRDDDLSKAKRAKSSAESKKRSAASVIRKAFKGNFADFLIERHMDGMQKCTDYRGYNDEVGSAPGSIGTVDAAGRKQFNDENKKLSAKGKIEVKVEFAWEWLKGYCDNSQEGGVYYEVCEDADLRDADSKRVTAKDCREAIANYRKAQKEYMNANSDAERADREMKDLESSLSDARERANENAAKRQRGETTEAKCEDCDRDRGAYVGANLIAGGLATLFGYQETSAIRKSNAQLGFPTNAGSSLMMYGFPFMMNGIYGALGGQIGAGGFGCAGGVGGGGYPYGPNGMMGYPYGMNGGWNPYGGALGYPYDMYGNPLNGGMFMPGMNTWGLNGMNGLGNLGMMYPGAAMSGVIGGVLGNGFMGGMTPMLGGMLNGGVPMMGGYMGGNLNGPLGGAIGGVLGNNMMGGYLSGPLGGAFGGALGNNMMGGYLSGPLGGALGGVLGNNMMGGVLNGGGVLGGNAMMNQQMMMLQQQMMQAQMQYQMQLQQYQMQQYQQYQVAQYQRQSQLQGLYQELYSLTYRIEMIKNGYAMSGLGGAVNGYGALGGALNGALSGALGGVLSGAVGGVVSFGAVSPYYPTTSVQSGSATAIIPGRGR